MLSTTRKRARSTRSNAGWLVRLLAGDGGRRGRNSESQKGGWEKVQWEECAPVGEGFITALRVPRGWESAREGMWSLFLPPARKGWWTTGMKAMGAPGEPGSLRVSEGFWGIRGARSSQVVGCRLGASAEP